MSGIQRDGDLLRLSEGQTGPACLVASYHMNPLPRGRGKPIFWFLGFVEGLGLDWITSEEYTDPRLQMLIEQIQRDFGNRNSGRCPLTTNEVVLSLYRVQGNNLLDKQNIQSKKAINRGTSIRPFTLTGGTNAHDARDILDECRTIAGHKILPDLDMHPGWRSRARHGGQQHSSIGIYTQIHSVSSNEHGAWTGA